jgi:hypothetical protein
MAMRFYDYCKDEMIDFLWDRYNVVPRKIEKRIGSAFDSFNLSAPGGTSRDYFWIPDMKTFGSFDSYPTYDIVQKFWVGDLYINLGNTNNSASSNNSSILFASTTWSAINIPNQNIDTEYTVFADLTTSGNDQLPGAHDVKSVTPDTRYTQMFSEGLEINLSIPAAGTLRVYLSVVFKGYLIYLW